MQIVNRPIVCRNVRHYSNFKFNAFQTVVIKAKGSENGLGGGKTLTVELPTSAICFVRATCRSASSPHRQKPSRLFNLINAEK